MGRPHESSDQGQGLNEIADGGVLEILQRDTHSIRPRPKYLMDASAFGSRSAASLHRLLRLKEVSSVGINQGGKMAGPTDLGDLTKGFFLCALRIRITSQAVKSVID
jgi:hypothetical protein